MKFSLKDYSFKRIIAQYNVHLRGWNCLWSDVQETRDFRNKFLAILRFGEKIDKKKSLP